MLEPHSEFSPQEHTRYSHLQTLRYRKDFKILGHNSGPIFHKDRINRSRKQRWGWLPYLPNVHCYVIRDWHIETTDFGDLIIRTTLAFFIRHDSQSPIYPLFRTTELNSICNSTKTKLNWNHTYSEQLLLCHVHTVLSTEPAQLELWYHCCNTPFTLSYSKPVNEMLLV